MSAASSKWTNACKKTTKDVFLVDIRRDAYFQNELLEVPSREVERYGLIDSSEARRIRTYGIWVENKLDAPTWFLNEKRDIRLSYILEKTAMEFDIQGLELDWSILHWNANLRYSDGKLEHLNFKRTKWQNIKNPENILYQKNAYPLKGKL